MTVLGWKFLEKPFEHFPSFMQGVFGFHGPHRPCIIHILFNNVEEAGFLFRIRPSGSNDGVNLFRIGRSKVWGESEQHVHVWKAVLLELDGINIAMCRPKNVVFYNFINY
jgi:hypothetical protein